MPGRAFFPVPFRRISVSFSQPIYPKGYSSDELAAIVQNKINKMVSE